MLERTAWKLLGNAAAAVDMAVSRTALSRSSGHARTSSVRHESRLALLGRLRDRYEALGAYGSFFREPRAIQPHEVVRLETPDGLVVRDLSWSSDYETFLPEVADEYMGVEENATATARLVTHQEGGPRPVVILVHGYLGGVHRMERRIWPMEFLRRIGLDAALFVLPFHGRRAARGPLVSYPLFPGSDPRITNEGFRQAMGDLRDFVSFLFDRGHPSVGVMGMSLGAFSSALAVTVEPRLKFAVPIIPLASIADIARDSGRLGRTPAEQAAQLAAIEPIYKLTSPLQRPLLIPPSNVLVVAGEQDHITPISHARKLAAHFRCRLETWPGGHLVQFGRAEKFRSIGRFLNEVGVISRAQQRAL